LAARGDYAGVRALVRRSLLVFTGILGVMLVVLAVSLPWLLRVLVGSRLSTEQLGMVYGVFLALVPFHLILSLDAPWVTVAIAFRHAGRVALIGTSFIAIFWLVATLLRPSLGVYAIPPAMAIAQAHSYAWYRASGRRLLRRRESRVAEVPLAR